VAGNFGSRGVTGGINFAAQTSPAFRGSVNNFSRKFFLRRPLRSATGQRAPRRFIAEVQSALAERAVLAVRAALAARPAIHLVAAADSRTVAAGWRTAAVDMRAAIDNQPAGPYFFSMFLSTVCRMPPLR